MPRAHKTTGAKEEALLKKARELKRDPSPLLPALSDECPTAPFDRIRSDLTKVKESADDVEALKKYMVRGENLARAYAALLYFAEERPEAVMAVVAHPTGTIPYLTLGTASPEGQIAVQYYDDPRRLLLGYANLAKAGLFGGGGFHFYALERRVVCTGKEARPPAEFISATIARLPYKLLPMESKGLKKRVCAHLQRGETLPFLEISWAAAEMTFNICRKCVREDAHLLASLLESMAVPNPDEIFEVKVEYPLEHKHQGQPCQVWSFPAMSASNEKRYRKGKISDSELLGEYLKECEGALLASSGALFVAGGRCFGSDAKAFVDDLSPTAAERKALTEVVGTISSPLLVTERTAGKALEALWKDHAQELVEAMGVTGEEEMRLVKEFSNSPGRVSELLERLYRKERERAVLSSLPEYSDLVPEAQFCIEISRLYRTQGDTFVEQRLASSLPESGKERGLAWGFLLAMGKAAERHEWRFTNTEKEFGEALSPAALKLLKASPEEYHSALSELLSAAGVTAWGTPVKNPHK
jgi:hypothetical protein